MIIWPLIVLPVVAVLVVLGRRSRRRLLAKTLACWGQFRDRPRDMAAIASYFRSRAAEKPDGWIDDRTWADLNMDEVFAILDRTQSTVGQQLLYTRLRRTPSAEGSEEFEALVTRLTNDRQARDGAVAALVTLQDPAGYDLWWLTQAGSLTSQPWHIVFPLLALAMGISLGLMLFWPPALLLLILGAMAGLALRSRVAPHLRVVAGAFRQVGPMLAAARRLRGVVQADSARLGSALEGDVRTLARLRRVASWAGRDSTGAAAGNLAAIAVEYLNLIFALDANALFFGAREMERRAPVFLRVLDAVGTVDAALSVASYRAGTAGWNRPAIRSSAGPVELVGLRHPLIEGARPNTLTLNPPNGVIITGSNMSGKSTLLRTVGVTAVMAQTIGTCLAEAYVAPPFVVRSCIGRADDPATGKSYYLVEVEAVLDIVRAARAGTPHLLLFDELFRGTNAVERIAAGEAVLHDLASVRDQAGRPRHLVIAATHDLELVDLLAGTSAAYHFADTLDDQGLSFDYRLQPGPATTRNAIALLGQRGAPPELVERALVRAASLERAKKV